MHHILRMPTLVELLCLARKYKHLRINQIQLRFLHFNPHSRTLLGIHMRHWAYKREKYTFINTNIKVINTTLKVNRDNRHTLKSQHYSLTFMTLSEIQWHSLTTLGWIRQTLMRLYNQLSVLYI